MRQAHTTTAAATSPCSTLLSAALRSVSRHSCSSARAPWPVSPSAAARAAVACHYHYAYRGRPHMPLGFRTPRSAALAATPPRLSKSMIGFLAPKYM